MRMECGCEHPELPGRPGALDVRVEDIHDGCPATWSLLASGRTKGVFQLESRLGQSWVKRLKPTSLDHLAALVAILRPGVLDARDDQGVSATEHYCRRKNGEEDVATYHPSVEPMLADTYGLILYQEDYMSIARVVCGFDLAQVDKLRKATAKKVQSDVADVGRLFIKKGLEAGVVPEDTLRLLWDNIAEAGRYAFNRCVSGRTVISRAARGKFGHADRPVAEMYRVRNDLAYAKSTGHEQLRRKWNRLGNYGKGLSMCEDGRIRPNTIVDIRPAGRRMVYRLTLDGGESVEVTDNHKFPTPDGYRRLDELVVGDCLFVCGPYEPSKKRYAFSDVTSEGRQEARESEPVKRRVNGAKGRDNWAYTNGSWTDFVNNRKLLPDVCGRCGRQAPRLEVHHRDGNRCDSGLNNLVKLCVGCHKREEYAAGRTRKGEKGYPSIVKKIVSIEPTGVDDTYDVTMEAPRHNFVVGGGIVTCNSHAYSYGLRSLRTAYLKAHFPLVFFASWLSHAHHKGLKRENGSPVDEKQALIDDARGFGVEVEPPDLAAVGRARRHFHPNQGRVRFGLGDVRGVGPGTLAELEAAADFVVAELGKPMGRLSWSECVFYFLYEVKTNVAQALVKAGAARMAPGRRAGLFQLEGAATAPTRLTPGELKAARGIVKAAPHLTVEEVLRLVARPRKDGGGCATAARIDLLEGAASLMARPPHSLDDEPGWVAAAEEDVLGVPLTASRCDGVDGADARCADLADPRPGTYRLAVEVVSVRPTVTKRGKSPGSAMAQLTVRDLSGPLRLACFPDAWAQAKDVVKEGSVVLLEVEVWDRGDLCVSARRAWRARGV